VTSAVSADEEATKNSFTNFDLVDLLPPNHQESPAGGKQDCFARVKRHPASFERKGS
jgi:hypothetical protein